MQFHPETQRIIKQTEKLSGRKVVIREDPALQTLANVTPAREASPFHLVRYRPGAGAISYLIAYQLGFTIRLFSTPKEDRFDVAATAEEKQLGVRELGLSDLPETLGPAPADQLITQLRTYSVGMRVDRWIRDESPGLIEEHEISANFQLSQNEAALDPEIRSKFPKPLVDANTAMNAAFAKFWADRLGESRFPIPFDTLGYSDVASDLCGSLTEIPGSPENDRDLISRWGDILKLADYFHFDPHSLDE